MAVHYRCGIVDMVFASELSALNYLLYHLALYQLWAPLWCKWNIRWRKMAALPGSRAAQANDRWRMGNTNNPAPVSTSAIKTSFIFPDIHIQPLVGWRFVSDKLRFIAPSLRYRFWTSPAGLRGPVWCSHRATLVDRALVPTMWLHTFYFICIVMVI